ncbi:ABC transporter permease [Microbacterium karelineae]|uniref:ABC transporter permease n=1 Tax=Microbacterium karelineae TaxID=2654283 RepID=UPI001E335387|nr:ABC transporter permease [Microbacterium karelineae]
MTAALLDAPVRRVSLGFLRERGMGASVLVAALSSAFGVVLLAATGYIGFLAESTLAGDSVALYVGILTILLIAIAMYVGAIVTANTFSTIVAGRTRRIALMRLIGATARSERTRVANQGLVVGLIGAAIGSAIGVALAFAGTAIAGNVLDAPGYGAVLQPSMIAPFVAVVLTTWAAAWAGSRRVLTVTPSQALGGSVERSREEVTRRSARGGFAIVFALLGVLLLTGGLIAGLFTPLAIMIGFVGGLLSFTALVMGSTAVMPPVLRLVGRMFGGSATSRMAAENALRYPERSSRMAIGVVVGVTLVTMFAVASESAQTVIFEGLTPQQISEYGYDVFFDTFTGVMMGLVAISAVIAAVGLVNLLTIGVVQRRTELGLLRALGLSSGQIRRMVLLEAAHITIAATALGLLLGIAYGWVGAQSLLGSVPSGGILVAPAVPWEPVLIVVASMAILTLLAAVAPTRLATRVSPVEALAVA